MSAYAIGRESGSAALAADGGTDFIGRLIRWIPGDAIVIYTAGINILQDDNPSWWLFIGGIALCVVLVVLGALKRHKTVDGKDATLAVLAVVAFVIWSVAIPASAWYDIDWFADNPELATFIAGAIALVFSQVADLLAPS